jgi:hypothetical protein
VIQSLGPVVVTVPARASSVHVLRAVVARVAARLPPPTAEAEERRTATDEAAVLLLHLHAPASTLRAELEADPQNLTIRLSSDVPVDGNWPPPGTEEAWPWRVITGLADEAGFDVSGDGPIVWMRMHRRADPT